MNARVAVINREQELEQNSLELLLSYFYMQAGWIAALVSGEQIPDLGDLITQIFGKEVVPAKNEEMPQWKREKAIMDARVIDHNIKVKQQRERNVQEKEVAENDS